MNNKLNYIFILLPTISIIFGLYFLKNAILSIIFYHIGIIAILFFSNNIKLIKETLKGWNNIVGLFFIILAPSVGLLSYILWPIIFKNDLNFYQLLKTFGFNNYNWIIFIIYFSTINPILEEIFWRAYFNNKKYYSKNIFTIQDFGFAFYHLFVLIYFIKIYWLIIIFIFLYIASCLFRFIYIKYKGLLIPIISHIVADISIIVVASLKRI